MDEETKLAASAYLWAITVTVGFVGVGVFTGLIFRSRNWGVEGLSGWIFGALTGVAASWVILVLAKR